MLEFAKKNYKHVVYLNFFENPDYASVFAGSLDIDNIVMLLSALLGKEADLRPERPFWCWTRYRIAPRPEPH